MCIRDSLSEDSTFIQGTCSRSDGSFELLPPAPGNYLLQIASIGYKTLCQPCPTGSTHNWILQTDAVLLAETVITAARPVFRLKGGKLETSVRQTLLASLNDANDVLDVYKRQSMHCSANTNMEGTDSAIFFGLSGTGKTTLSTDPKRLLIGDDEHGWDDEGVFNYEGGCYAKVINLDKESEPDIYAAIKRDALLENVTVAADGKIDFADKSVTENTRVSYPIYHINNIVKPVSKGPHAHQVIFLSADAFGVLPPVSILNPEQAQYYFLSGFTAKLSLIHIYRRYQQQTDACRSAA